MNNINSCPLMTFDESGNIYVSCTPFKKMESTKVEQIKNNFIAQNDPSTLNDSTQGYNKGSFWLNLDNNTLFVCTNPLIGNAQWIKLNNTTL